MNAISSYDWMGKWAMYSPNKTAIEEAESGKTFTYANLNNQANAWAYYLTKVCGLTKGDRVVVISENRAEYVTLFSVAQKTGLVLVPLNIRLSKDEITYLIRDCQPKKVIVEEQFKGLTTDVADAFSIETFDQLKEIDLELNHTEQAALTEEDLIFILYTSGTTGNPKGALYTYKMLFWNSINTQMRLDLTCDDITINVMPLFHTGGWNVLLTPFLHHGATTIISKKFEAEGTLKMLSRKNITLFMAVPTMLKMMAETDYFSEAQLPHLRYFVVGGEAMPIPLIEKWAEKNVPVRQGYGLTEVGPNVTSLHHDDAFRKKGSIGTPNFYIDYQIITEEGKPAQANERGEFQLAGPNVTPGYWHNEEANQKAFNGKYFKTGDVVIQDEEGYIYVVDRIKNMYISGGENVYPAEVEKVLRTHPEINDVAVVGVTDPKWGETGLAAIVSGNKSLSAEDLKTFCAHKLAKFKMPSHVIHFDQLPKSDTGKIDKKSIKLQFNN